MKLGQNVCLEETQTSSKMGHVGSKTRSLDQILEKTLCMLKRPHFRFDTHETWSKCLLRLNFERVRKWVMRGQKLGQILEKPCLCSGDLILVQILIKLGQNVCLDNF